MNDKAIKEFVKDRDEAFTKFVIEDDWNALYAYLRKYRMYADAPKNKKVLAASIYKAVQECTSIPAYVKGMAWGKCEALGFKPTIGGTMFHD